MEAELDRPVLTIAPCMTVDVPGVEPVWVLIGDNINAVEREILLYLGAKSINESSGPLVFDCPVWMFELATNTKDKKWRDECVQYWMSREETDLT